MSSRIYLRFIQVEQTLVLKESNVVRLQLAIYKYNFR